MRRRARVRGKSGQVVRNATGKRGRVRALRRLQCGVLQALVDEAVDVGVRRCFLMIKRPERLPMPTGIYVDRFALSGSAVFARIDGTRFDPLLKERPLGFGKFAV